MDRRLACFLVALACLSFACDRKTSPTTPSSTPTPTTLIVGQGGSFTTIQSALNATKGGETIDVRAGTYGERVVIDRPVTLRGMQAIVDGRAGGLDGKDIGIRVRASNVVISGFIVQNFERGIVLEGGNRQQIRDNRFLNNGTQVMPGCASFGIQATGDNQFIDNDISGSTWGIYAPFTTSGSVIRENRIHGNGRSGISMIGSSNRIEQNDATGNHTLRPASANCAQITDIGFDLYDQGTVSNAWIGNLGIANFVQANQARIVAPTPLLHRPAL
jgi:parallel beta-helix repeat protein